MTRAEQLTQDLIERFQRHLFYYRKKGGQPLSISSQSHWLTAIRSWMKWLKDQRVIERNPALEMVFPKQEKRLPRHALTQEEVEAVLAQPDITRPCGLRMRAILEILYSSGLRRQEVLRLERSDIDRERRVVLVRLGKGKKDRFVPLGERALHWLDKYLVEARWKLSDDPTQPLVFVSTHGNALHPNQISAHVRGLMNQAGITKKGPCHLFRHTAASFILDAGAGICRPFSAMKVSVRLKSTRTYRLPSCAKCTIAPIRRGSFAVRVRSASSAAGVNSRSASGQAGEQ